MTKQDQLQRVLDTRIVAVIRATSGERLVDVARALIAGGVDVLEITFTVPRAIDVLKRVVDAVGGEALVGAGTVLDSETARAAMLAGAEFIVSPNTNVDVIRLCRRYDKLVMPGAFTPTEVLAAWEAGADIVKIFPCDSVGPGYLKALHGPFPKIRLMPTGGIDIDNAAAFLKAGACALGVGSSLVSKGAVDSGDMAAITAMAKRFVAVVQEVK
jgi:2-dehydro-3-deoxyphosphogluconate aldolase/(4S)-4-hydroxy-2-oxoglutarate aldolase